MHPLHALIARHPRLDLRAARIPPGWLDLVDGAAVLIGQALPEGVAFVTRRLEERPGQGRLVWLFDLAPVPEDADEIMSVVVAAEARSAETCAVCGAAGGPVERERIVMTLCTEHGAAYCAGAPTGRLYADGWALAVGRADLQRDRGAYERLRDA